MPVTYAIDETRSLIVTTLVGSVSRDELFAYLAELAADPRGASCTKSLVDLELSTPVDGSPEWMQSISARTEAAEGVEKLAIVAPDDLRYGLSRAYEAYVSGRQFETRVFKTRIEAEEWLEL